MIFQDRKDAGEKLAQLLGEYKKSNTVVLGIPRGGIEIGYYIASQLNAEFSVIVSKRLAYPGHEQYDFGAICEEETIYIRDTHSLSDDLIRNIVKKSKHEIDHSIRFFRKGATLPALKGKTVIITDDGIVTGVTLVPAIRLCRKLEAEKIVVAVPVAAKTPDKNIMEADEIKVLHYSESHKHVEKAYRSFKRLNDEEAVTFIRNFPVSLS